MNLLEPFTFEFFRNGFIVATISGAICGLIGVYVVLRHMSYIGHGLSHSIFGGAAVSAVLSFNYYVGAGIWGLISAFLITAITRRSRVGADAAIGVTTTASFAIGIVLSNVFGQARQSIDNVLFGSVLGVTALDILAIGIVAIVAIAVIWVYYRQLLFATFDPEVAEVSGVSIKLMEALLIIMLASTILFSMKVLGVLLISAMLVTPAVTARMLTNSFQKMLTIAPAIGAGCGAIGMLLSYHIDTSPGATIIIVASALFLIVFNFSGIRSPSRKALSD